MSVIKLAEAIKFKVQAGRGTFDVGDRRQEVDSMLRAIAYESVAGYSLPEAHALLAQNIVEPIRVAVSYAEMYSQFFAEHNIGDQEDPAIPVENLPVVAFETTSSGAVMFVRATFTWARPELTTFDTGIEVGWEDLRRAGWNFLARQMVLATEALARKRDAVAKSVIDAAVPAAHQHTVSGGTMTRSAFRGVLSAAQSIGLPMTRALINSGRATDMAEWTWPTGQNVDAGEAGLITNLHLGNYGGCEIIANPHAPSDVVYFFGPADALGYHVVRGTARTVSDVDIRNKTDLHAILDAWHAWYVGNPYNLHTLTITS